MSGVAGVRVSPYPGLTTRGRRVKGNAGEAGEIHALTPEELTAANARALELDRRAYTMVPEVYGLTEPAVLRCQIPAPGTPPVVGPPSPPSPTAPPPLCPPAVPTPPAEAPPV